MYLKELTSEITSLTTVNGTEKRKFDRKVIKVAKTDGTNNGQKIYTMESLEIERIGSEKGHMIPYVNIIADLMEMQEELKQHFESQCDTQNEEIKVIISQRDGAKFMSEVQPEQIGLHQHHLLPNVNIYQNELLFFLIDLL